MQKKKTCLFLFLILIVGFFFRFWRLESLPPGVYPDEAINGNDALKTLQIGDFKFFYPENNGREGVFIWLLATSFYLFGPSVWSLKFIPALTGLLTVFGLFLLTKELFSFKSEKENERLALFSALFISVSFWHVNFSRIGFRAILLPAVLSFSFYFLWKGLHNLSRKNEKDHISFFLSGAIFGIGFYTYASFRMAVFLLGIVLATEGMFYLKQKKIKLFLSSSLAFIFGLLLIALPLGIHFLNNPQYFVGRASQVFFFNQPDPLKALVESIVLHLGMFNFYGDQNWRHNLPSSPQLCIPVGILFLIGLAVSLKSFFRSINKKDWHAFNLNLFLFGWFGIMLSPGFLTAEGIPHALRTIGVIPVTYIFASIGLLEIWKRLKRRINNEKTLRIIVLFFLVSIIILQGYKYFIKWGESQEAQGAFAKDFVEIGRYLNSLPPKTKTVVVVNRSGVPVPWPDGIPMPAQTVMFIENTKFGKPRSLYVLPDNIVEIKETVTPDVIVPLGYDEELLEKIGEIFPQGKVQVVNNKFLIYKL